MKIRFLFLSALLVLASPPSRSEVSESSIGKQIGKLRSMPDAQRPDAMIQIAKDIGTLPAGPPKLKLADTLSHLVTEGDPGHGALQAAGDALAQALTDTPVPPKGDEPPAPYLDLARLVRYEGVTTDLKDPMLVKALETLASNYQDVQKADFTLSSVHGPKVTLSQLRGKIVLVNFWATWCPPCQKEMRDLDLIYTHYQSQGLVVLSLTSESAPIVDRFLRGKNYHPDVLLDDGGKVAKAFHVTGLPRTFVFDREGKLIAVATDMRTQKQFFEMLGRAGLKPM